MESFAPERFGPYQLLRRVGVGGMAEVFLANYPGIGGFERYLCIKRILPEHANDTEFIDLLIHEAKLVSRISHPNVAQVFDLGKVDDQYYLAMEWIDGVDTLALLRACEKREVHVPIPAAAFIVHEVARGLHAAHTQTDDEGRPLGIVHRDVTPSNVLISFDGAVKLIDFGVARNMLRSRQTAIGVVKGKYNYLAPEQARGERVDARADVFAAGIVLYELLAGEPLYPGTNAAEVLAKARAAKVPSLRKIRPEVPAELERIVLKALARDREARTPTAQALADELEGFLMSHAPGYGAAQLAQLLRYFFPDRAAAAAAGGPPSIISVPGDDVAEKDADAPDEEEALAAAPTRVATAEEIDARRAARAAGLEVPAAPVSLPQPRPAPPPQQAAQADPAPSLPRASSRSRRGTVAAIAVGALILTGIVSAAALALWPREARLRITTTPAGATVRVDGRAMTAVTPAEIPVEPGEHLVEITLPGHEPYVARHTVEDDTGITVALRPTAASLEIVSDPPGAIVLQEGLVLGTTPLSLDGLPVGVELRYELRAPGYEPLVHVHHTTNGGFARVELRLTPASGRASIGGVSP